jgi:GNAT superfamily N-acetyltransferase
MRDSSFRIRPATDGDRAAVADLANELALSFAFCRDAFDASYTAALGTSDACLLLAVAGDDHVGYLLGTRQVAFYANGPVAHVQEILVHDKHRRRGVGRLLMKAFEQWAAERGCALVALATRRAAPFYLALGYEESATYLRKVLREPAAC